jgi:hypothetical protein
MLGAGIDKCRHLPAVVGHGQVRIAENTAQVQPVFAKELRQSVEVLVDQFACLDSEPQLRGVERATSQQPSEELLPLKAALGDFCCRLGSH